MDIHHGTSFLPYFLLGFLLTRKPIADCIPVSSKGNDQRGVEWLQPGGEKETTV